MGEGDSDRGQLGKCRNGHCRFDQRQVAVHRTSGGKIARHQHRRIRFSPVHPELVIGLLVAAGVAAGAHVQAFGIDLKDISCAFVQTHRRTQSRRARSDDQCMQFLHGQNRRMERPPSTLMTCPVE